MAEAKTKPTKQKPEDFIAAIDNQQRRSDAQALLKIFNEVTGQRPVMWGPSIIGYGIYKYKYASGREGEWPLSGFSPRKQNLTVYIMDGFDDYDELLSQLGPHTTGKSCLYIKRLSDVNVDVLKSLIKKSIEYVEHASREN